MPALAADNPAEAVELGRVDVIGTTPLPGLGVLVERVPANVQVFRRGARDRALTLPDFLQRDGAGAISSAAQGNPFQPDLVFRGFAASPLLGLPQGLAVFQDGVRVNEPFGDVVNWDLLPSSAIGSIQVIPGTSPIFGPNTLGGAIAVYTKSGSQYPGGSVEASGGSRGRRALQIEQGGSDGPWDGFATVNLLRERGWAAHNPSDVRQLFAKGGYQTEASDLDASLTLADNRLEGAQMLPASFLGDIRQSYTWPDVNTNRLAMVALKGSRFAGEGVLLGASAYVRQFRNENISSNVNPDAGSPAEPEATNDRTATAQRSHGAGLQVTWARPLAGRDNQFQVGATADIGRTRFTRATQPARFTSARGTEALGPFVPATDADTSVAHYGVYATDTFVASEHWVLTFAARHDVTRVEIEDRSGTDPRLSGQHRFARLDPAAGVNFVASPRLTIYAGYNEGMRAPTAMELACAEPSAPCKLPNAFLADPALGAIVARTIEAGARGRFGNEGSWSAAIFRTALADDIQFVSAGAAGGAGYFRNVGATRRMGLELSTRARLDAWRWAARYGWVDATFRSPFTTHSPSNSSADAAGDILVLPGDRIPGVPRHVLRLRAEYAASDTWSVALSTRAASRVFVRGDENNRDASGALAGHAVFDASVAWQPSSRVELLAWVENLWDRRYAAQGMLGRNVFNGPGHTFDPGEAVAEQFRAVGAPRGAWIAMRYRWS